ncbi:gp10, partial [Listeria seeligeri FSL N1-067]
RIFLVLMQRLLKFLHPMVRTTFPKKVLVMLSKRLVLWNYLSN